MAGWDDEQDALLRQFGHLGAEACREIIYRRTGVARSVDATERHANRIGASLVRYETCPQCGRKVERLNKCTGLCKTCNERHLLEGQRRHNIRLLREVRRRQEDGEYERYAREHATVRQENSRLAREHGLPTLREWKREGGCEEIVDLSVEMSVPRSEPRRTR